MAKKRKRKIKARLWCPYCKHKDVQVELKKTQDEYDCSKCNKRFMAICGTVRGASGLGGHSVGLVRIRIKNIEGGESLISYPSSYQGLDVRSGDLVSAIYKKSWITGNYGSKPTVILNFTLETYTTQL